jgi:hypothetical protein
MTVPDCIRHRLSELVELAGVLDARLEDGTDLPGMVVCRLGVAVDETVAALRRHADALVREQ